MRKTAAAGWASPEQAQGRPRLASLEGTALGMAALGLSYVVFSPRRLHLVPSLAPSWAMGSFLAPRARPVGPCDYRPWACSVLGSAGSRETGPVLPTVCPQVSMPGLTLPNVQHPLRQIEWSGLVKSDTPSDPGPTQKPPMPLHSIGHISLLHTEWRLPPSLCSYPLAAVLISSPSRRNGSLVQLGFVSTQPAVVRVTSDLLTCQMWESHHNTHPERSEQSFIV